MTDRQILGPGRHQARPAKILSRPTWWKIGLMYGTAMFIVYSSRHAIHGDLTLRLVGREFLIWQAAGVTFGILLTAVMSLLSRKNLFRGFPGKQGGR